MMNDGGWSKIDRWNKHAETWYTYGRSDVASFNYQFNVEPTAKRCLQQTSLILEYANSQVYMGIDIISIRVGKAAKIYSLQGAWKARRTT